MMDKTFESRLYGYSMAYPDGWTPSAATVKWVPRERFDFPQDYPAEQVDVISHTRFRTIWVASSPIADDRPVAEWAAERLPRRTDSNGICLHNAGPIRPLVQVWMPRVVRGYPAVGRDGCGFVDVVIDLGDRVVVVSAPDTNAAWGDEDGRALFESFLFSLRFDEDPSTGAVITSNLYDYRIRPGEGAVARLATEPWDGLGGWDDTPIADRFSVDGQLFTVAAIGVEPGMTARDYVDAHQFDRPRVFRTGYSPPACQRGGTFRPTLTADQLKWNPDQVAGRDALIRAACGHVDAVVIAGGKAWLLHSATQVWIGADIVAFRRVADTIEFPSGTHLSEVYGYRITPQEGALTRLATEPWDGVGAWDMPPTADRFSGDGHLFTVAAVDVEPGTTARTFVDAHGLDRPREFRRNLSPPACQRGNMLIPGLTAHRLEWNTDVVAGREAMIRGACGHVDAVVIAKGKAWILHSAGPAGLGADIEAFRRVADTIFLE
jgi:hypothetical protein